MTFIYEDTQRKSSESRPENFSALEPIDKLILAVVVLRQALVAEFNKHIN